MKFFHPFSILLIGLVFSCSDRERLNPLDPNNPNTHGKPTGFRAETNRDTIRLYWDNPALDDLSGFHIYFGNGDSDLKLLDSTHKAQTSYMKTGLRYDTPFHFALKTKTIFGESRLSDPLSVVLGPVNIWIADILNNMIWYLSYDGSYILKQNTIFNPTAIAYETATETLWMANYYEKKIIGMDRGLISKNEIVLSDRPVDLAFDKLGKIIYVLQTDSTIQGFTTGGLVQVRIKLAESISLYNRLAFDAKTGSLWVTSLLHNSVFRAETSNELVRITTYVDLEKPYSVEPDPIDGGVWISTYNGILRIKNDNTKTVYKSGMYISDISVNPINGDCYYTARSLDNGTWETGRLPYANPGESEQILSNEFPDLTNIKIIPSGSNFGFIVHQSSTGKLLRFNAKSELIGEMKTFDSFLDFALD